MRRGRMDFCASRLRFSDAGAALRVALTAMGLAVGCLALGACGPKVKPGLGLEVWVEGNTAEERAGLVSVTFDRAMVEGSTLGKELKLGSKVPFRIEPRVDGVVRWREDRKLTFEPSAPLPRSTAFVVTIPKGTHAPDHVGLVEDYEFKFETERLSLTSSLVQTNGLPSPKRWATAEQQVTLDFNQPVHAADVLTACRYHSPQLGVQVGTAFAQAEAEASEQLARQRFVVRPIDRLNLDSTWELRCDPTLHAAEGPLTLQQNTGPSAGDGEGPDGVLGFRTFGPFKAEAVIPAGNEVDPDTASISLRFSTPPAQPSGPSPISILPAPEEVNANVYVSDDMLVARVRGLAPYTDYKVEVAGGLRDVFGQQLHAPFSATFRTGGIRPGYDLETGSWSVESSRGGYVAWARNIDRVEVRGGALTEEQLFDVLPALTWWDREMVDLKKLKIPMLERSVKPEGPPNRWNQVQLDPKALFGQGTGRFFYIASRAPGVQDPYDTDDNGKPLPQGYREVLLNVTDLGLTTKLSGNSGLVWVTRLSDGRPQPNADISVRQRSGAVLWRGTTDEHGLATLPGKAQLLGTKPATQVDPEGEERSWADAQVLVFARVGNDVTFADPERTGAFSPWHFGVSVEQSEHERALRGFLHTDRGLYRPGDTVHARGLARLLELRGSLIVPPQANTKVSIYDPRGEQILQRDVPLSRFGGFSLDYAVSEASALGDYRIQAQFPEGVFSETFTVEEFRANTFEVKLSSPLKAAFAGDELQLSALGNYFYGSPVRSAGVTFRVHSSSRAVHFEGYPDFVFGDEAKDYDYYSPYGEESFITEQSLKLDARGQADVKLALPKEQFSGPSTLLLSATVQDETNQTVSANLTLPLHRTRLYLGIDSGGWTAPTAKPHKVRLVALSPEGKPVSANVKFSAQKRSWSCAWERWGYTGSYRCEEKLDVISSAELALSAGQPLEHSVTYPSAGQYALTVEGTDSKGNAVKSARNVWVWGDGDGGWRADDSGQFKIIADKEQYRVGDTARLLLQTSTKGATVLVTVERDGVLEQRVLDELAPGQAIEVPITGTFAPNAYVSVMLARGRTGEGSRGLPKTTMGVVNLPVATGDKRLSVQVETDRPDYRPGQPVTATIVVKDSAGLPVEAEVALAAADEGVLSLIDFKTPDPLTRFFRAWGLGVTTTSQYERLAQVPAPGQERYVTGGDSAGAPGTFRSRFRATAYWNPAVLTDAQGVAKVTFDAPDNLTAFRLMAVAANTKDNFGSSDKRFVVNKPVQLLSALPRFASVGDQFDAAVMVTNDTAQASTGNVKFWVEGALAAEGASPLSKEISVPSGGRMRVAFPVRGNAPGKAKLRFAVELGAERDGLEQELEVNYPTFEETLVVSEGATDSRVQLPVQLPEGTLAGSAALEISVDPDGLAGLEDSLRELIQYPYGCLEQTTSRLIPLVAVQELTKAASLEELQGDKVKLYIEIAVAKIYRHQTASGGFGLWPGSEPEAYLTAYALWGLSLAQEAGYSVNANVLNRGMDYLRNSLSSEDVSSHGHSEMGELGSRAFALYVLSVLKRPEAGHTTALAERADKMPTYGQAFLARALASVVGEAHASVGSLLARWTPSGSAQSALIKEANASAVYWYWSSDVRSTAVVLDTLVALRPGDPRIPRLVKGLLDERRGQGSWDTTQERLYALVALTHYAQARAGASAKVELARGPDLVLKDELNGKGLARVRHLRLPTEPGDVRPLSISATEGTVYYRVLLRHRRDKAHQPASSRGMTLKRTFLDPETGSVLASAKEGQMVRVRLELGTDRERNRVALSDHLPAGLEPINTRFTTAPSYVTDESERTEWYDRLWVTHRELGEERVDAFMDWLQPGHAGKFEYLARATTVGKFVVPAASVEQMYDPDVQARTELSSFEVVAR